MLSDEWLRLATEVVATLLVLQGGSGQAVRTLVVVVVLSTTVLIARSSRRALFFLPRLPRPAHQPRRPPRTTAFTLWLLFKLLTFTNARAKQWPQPAACARSAYSHHVVGQPHVMRSKRGDGCDGAFFIE